MTNEEALQQIQHLIGSRYVPTVKAYISELTGRPRVVGLKDVATREFDTQRIGMTGDDAGIVTAFSFG
ncbi:hypothetical protein QN400_18045 [Pseudomonas sp. RTC3]|uniref:hypothetical protein n=1 Tax=unclassified Pseudomonas TaxID=196821 RepID=UPI002AB3D71D|nr:MULTISPECIES: hypothetical protein [unclassified Pseudomonas]MEB0063919.1 hypothetical protein [Pseudomonas sp. RTC3]MDY7567684.1 hypothetical protein [Pseudomonas sp. 5C2]MEB0007700.1 hypothetical protein [Pseudomonas sp. RTB2]MEB0018699.1 hypothetical protein [Pseudomonas sp. RTB3]MEB0026731.1 hypothetical protein [Pseudomonas sp. MH9.2]